MFISDYFAMNKILYWNKYHNTLRDVLQHLMTLFYVIFPYYSLIFVISVCIIIPSLYTTSTHLLCNGRLKFVALKADSCFCRVLYQNTCHFLVFFLCKYSCGFRFGIGLIKANCLMLLNIQFSFAIEIRLRHGRF